MEMGDKEIDVGIPLKDLNDPTGTGEECLPYLFSFYYLFLKLMWITFNSIKVLLLSCFLPSQYS